MKTKGKNLSQLWKRNMVVAAIAVFVCAAVYLNWNYEQEVGKTLGESAMAGKEDPLVSGGGSSAPARRGRATAVGRPLRAGAILTPRASTASSPGTVPLPCSRRPPGRSQRTRP